MANVTGYIGSVFGSLVDRVWTPVVEACTIEEPLDPLQEICQELHDRKEMRVVMPSVEYVKEPEEPIIEEKVVPMKKREKAANLVRSVTKSARRKKRRDKPTESEICDELFLPQSRVSIASTCISSDGEEDDREENEEDIGALESRLMRERAEEIRRLTMKSSRKWIGRTKKDKKDKKQKEIPTYPDINRPMRLRNLTNSLWNWTVFSGFRHDQREQQCLEWIEEDKEMLNRDDDAISLKVALHVLKEDE